MIKKQPKNGKKYLISSINFGEIGNKARVFVEEFIKIKGQKKLSEFIRKLIIKSFDTAPEFKPYQLKVKIQEHRLLKKKIARLLQKKVNLDKKLRKKGVDPDKEYEIIHI